MAKMKLIYTTLEKLNDLPIEDGQIIYIPDSNAICLDLKGERYTYHTLQTFETEEERIDTIGVNRGFYFVEETNIMWQYIGNQWKRITPENLTPVVYIDNIEHFPSQGEENVLYYTDKGVYNWKQALNKYNLIANANTWEAI